MTDNVQATLDRIDDTLGWICSPDAMIWHPLSPEEQEQAARGQEIHTSWQVLLQQEREERAGRFIEVFAMHCTPAEMADWPDILWIPCPHCAVREGEECQTASGRPCHPHVRRHRMLIQAQVMAR